jgi:2-C-methyl-D-erythritol 4-phosphate cytidylyltransferase
VAAAGASTRMNGQNKLFIDIDGKPVLAHTLRALEASRRIEEIVVVTRREEIERVARLCAEEDLRKDKGLAGERRVWNRYIAAYGCFRPRPLIAGTSSASFCDGTVIAIAVDAALVMPQPAPPYSFTIPTIKRGHRTRPLETLDRETLSWCRRLRFQRRSSKGGAVKRPSAFACRTDDAMAASSRLSRSLDGRLQGQLKLTTAMDMVVHRQSKQKEGKAMSCARSRIRRPFG